MLLVKGYWSMITSQKSLVRGHCSKSRVSGQRSLVKGHDQGSKDLETLASLSG